MPTSRPPGINDHDAYVHVSNSTPDDFIVEGISSRLAASDALTPTNKDDQLFVEFRGQQHRIPLTDSLHDRYVTVSSLVELLKGHYRFFLNEASTLSSTHELLVATVAEAQSWGSLPQHLTELQPGVDYFVGIRVPYLNHEDAAPEFERDRRRFLKARAAMEKFILTAMRDKKVDPAVCSGLAQLVTKDPARREQAGLTADASDNEISSVFYEVLCAALDEPDKQKAFTGFSSAIRLIEMLTSGRWPVPE